MKKQNGVTLIALVITIVVLLILAAVSINMVLGDNGIFTNAKKSKTAMNYATIKENIANSIAYVKMESVQTDSTINVAWYTSSDAGKGTNLFATEIAKTKELLEGKITGYDETGGERFRGTYKKPGDATEKKWYSENGKVYIEEEADGGFTSATYNAIDPAITE